MIKRLALSFAFLLPGACVSTVATVVTAPVRLVGKGVNLVAPGRKESDRRRGQKIRKAEEKARKSCRSVTGGDEAREQCFHERMRNEGY